MNKQTWINLSLIWSLNSGISKPHSNQTRSLPQPKTPGYHCFPTIYNPKHPSSISSKPIPSNTLLPMPLQTIQPANPHPTLHTLDPTPVPAHLAKHPDRVPLPLLPKSSPRVHVTQRRRRHQAPQLLIRRKTWNNRHKQRIAIPRMHRRRPFPISRQNRPIRRIRLNQLLYLVRRSSRRINHFHIFPFRRELSGPFPLLLLLLLLRGGGGRRRRLHRRPFSSRLPPFTPTLFPHRSWTRTLRLRRRHHRFIEEKQRIVHHRGGVTLRQREQSLVIIEMVRKRLLRLEDFSDGGGVFVC